MTFSDARINELRNAIEQKMSGYRLSHTLGVERAARALGELYMPNEIDELCVAALLHDITKELSPREHIALLEKNGVAVSEDDIKSPKILHAKTAEYEARASFFEFTNDKICQALRYHTTGNKDMTLFDAIIYLADYIEDTRSFDDCVRLREYFWFAKPEEMSREERESHLWQTVLISLDMTVKDIEAAGGYVSSETLFARDEVAKKI